MQRASFRPSSATTRSSWTSAKTANGRRSDNRQHINVNDAIINGAAFWDMSMTGGEVTFNNVQGCTQIVGDKINLNDVRLNSCGAMIVPEPSTGLLLAFGFAGLAGVAHGRRRRS